ncbi:hypothetical protein IVA88_10195 [Bradyrhizobium sp. 149]|nr:hypothetical protein [Bradyrhizobium sp. 149]
MAKVSIRKEDYERILEVAERAARRTNSRVVVAMDRVDLEEPSETTRPDANDRSAALKFS